MGKIKTGDDLDPGQLLDHSEFLPFLIFMNVFGTTFLMLANSKNSEINDPRI